MAKLKRNQLNNIMFPMVDPTDFASIESGITASDFNSGITAKFYGVTHGNSTAFVSGTISKAATLVHSGVFQQTLKATETNYDFLIVRFYGHASMADQILMFEMVTSDDSDIVSLISDVNSNLLSFLAGMSGAISDVESQVDLLVTSNYLSAVHSDLLSAIAAGPAATVTASDISDIASAVEAILASVMSDTLSAAVQTNSRALVIQSMVSDVDSQLLLTHSLLSDVESAVDLIGTASNVASLVWDEVITSPNYNVANSAGRRLRLLQESGGYEGGAIWIDTVNGSGGTTDFENGTVTNPVNTIADANTLATSMGITNFRVIAGSSITFAAAQTGQTFEGENWTLALGNQSIVGSTFVGATVSGIASGTGTGQKFVDCFMNATTHIKETTLSRCALAGTQTIGEAGNYYTDACYSAVAGSSTPVWDFGGALAASDLSFRHYSGGIEVANMGAGAGTYNMSLEGNGQLVIAASCSATSNISIRGHFSITDNAGGAVTVTDDARFNVGQSMFIDASAMSNISSRVDSALASDLSNILSAAVQTNSRVILALSLISDVDSQLLLTHSLLSDVESQVDLLATSDYVSQIHSDLTSQIGGIAASVSASDISDIASAVEAILASVMSDTLSAAQEGSSRALVAQSLISDVDSQLLLTHSLLSDVESQVDLLVTSNYLSQVHSDLYSAVGAVAATVSPSDISDIASAVVDALASDFSDIQSQLSNAHSDLRSLMSTAGGAVTASDISDIASAVWATALATKLVQLNPSDLSDIRSAIAAGPAATVTASDISDIASAVEAILASVMSDTLSAAQEGSSRALVTQSLISDVDSQLLLTHSLLSDVESQVDLLATSNYLSQVHSDIVSAIGGIAASVSASDISDIASAVEAILASDLSDAISAAREGSSRALLNQSAISDVESQLDLTQSLLSDVESQVDLLATSDYLSAVHSDLASAIGAITVVLTPSDISDITSGILAGLAVTVFPTGAIDWDYNVTDSVTLLPISGVEVWVSTDNPAVNIIWKGTTDAFGDARDVLENVPALDAGTYYFWRQKSGYTFDNPDTEIVA